MRRLERSLGTTQRDDFERFVEILKGHDRVLFTASGTSYHASLLGVFFLNRVGIDAQTLIASEFKNYERVDEDTLVLAISQSGETKDVIDAIDFSRERGADIASVVNVPYSTVERKSDAVLRIEAGQEICVASTKAFTNQLYLLMRLAREMGYDAHLSDLPEKIEGVIEENEPRVRELARELVDKDDVYVIGRGLTYPVAREIALKMKEIPYIHTEGMMGGELKHGTLALVDEGVPVLSLIPEKDSEIKTNVKEVEARGAMSIKVSPWEGEFDIPSENSNFAYFATVLGFLLAYWVAYEKGLPIDQPRHLS
jgi:glucosamine--fructose-6-phosphate aminotransferase (isomerizing)